MPWTREYFVGQTYLGSGPAHPEIVHNEIHDPIGEAFFCPICSEIWAQALVAGQGTQVRTRPCAKHKPGDRHGTCSLGYVSQYDIPGSLWLVESRTWVNSLPERVLAREVLITLEWAANASVFPSGIASMCKDMVELIQQSQRKQK